MPLLTSLLARASGIAPRGSRFLDAMAAGAATRALLREGLLRWQTVEPDTDEILGGLLPWERAMASRAIRPGDRILLVGSGTGRELIALLGEGHEIVAVEPSERSSDIASALLARRGLGAVMLRGFFEDLPIPGRFDVVLFSHRCYGLIQGSASRVAALRKAAGALEPGGRILVSYLSGPPDPTQRLTRLVARLTGSDVPWEPGDTVYRIGTAPPAFGVEHMFATGEVDAEARAAGLEPEHLPDLGCRVAVLTPGAAR